MDFHTTVKETLASLERDFPGRIDQDTIDAVIADARRQRNEALFGAWRAVFVKLGEALTRGWALLRASMPAKAHQARLTH